ncbi:hypothetical protein M2359_003908 [Gordonia amarae]|nr:hypothetical protein [Gordonia amarae]
MVRHSQSYVTPSMKFSNNALTSARALSRKFDAVGPLAGDHRTVVPDVGNVRGFPSWVTAAALPVVPRSIITTESSR